MKYLIALLSLCLLASCKDEDPTLIGPAQQISFEDIDVVTGVLLKDANGSLIGQWRDPNTNSGPTSISPNPASDQISVLSIGQAISNIWLVEARCYQELDSTLSPLFLQVSDLEYNTDEIDALSVQSVELDMDLNVVNLNLEALQQPAFYRLFIELDNGNLHWHNLYLDEEVNTLLAFTKMDELCP